MRPTYSSYDTIPIQVFAEINKTGNLRLLGHHVNPVEAWFKIYDAHIERHGLNEEYKLYLEALKRWAQSQTDLVNSPTTMNEALAAIRQAELDSFFDEKEAVSIEENLAAIEQMMGGMKLNYKKVTALEYYNYLDFIKKRNGKNKA